MSSDVLDKPLTGKELLNKLKEIPEFSRTEKARACGYVVPAKGKASPRVSTGDFLNAVLAAKGIDVDPVEGGSRGRDASYRVSVHQNGHIVVGSTYTKKMGLQPGDEFEIKLGYKEIHLKQISRDEGDE